MNIKATIETKAQFTLTRTAVQDQWHSRFARLRMMLLLLLVDAAVLLFSCGLALFLWSFKRSDLYFSTYQGLIPLVFVFLTVYAITGLYSTSGINPVHELRQLSITTSVTFLGLGALSFWFRNAESFSRASFILGWIFALVLLPTCRELLRSLATRLGWWGEPIAIIGFGDQGDEFVQFLQYNPRLGFNPVILINGFYQKVAVGKPHRSDYPLPMMNAQGLANEDCVRDLKGIRTAIVMQNEVPDDFLHMILQDYGFRFSNLILVSNTDRYATLWSTPMDIGGVLGLHVRQNLMSSWQQSLKRTLDLTFVILASPLLVPVVGLIALLVWLDSPGGAFYAQERIGRGGKKIRVWKFRTMVKNADEVLERYLRKNPALRREWVECQKLKDDPRITRVGRILRKSSLDELPQVWNVLNGEMSLVGPRPIVDDEVHHYADQFKVYLQVRPGLTGLWQVSGRNDVDYPTRVRLDEYYVRNWSVWFDLYILARTPWKMITGNGAY